MSSFTHNIVNKLVEWSPIIIALTTISVTISIIIYLNHPEPKTNEGEEEEEFWHFYEVFFISLSVFMIIILVVIIAYPFIYNEDTENICSIINKYVSTNPKFNSYYNAFWILLGLFIISCVGLVYSYYKEPEGDQLTVELENSERNIAMGQVFFTITMLLSFLFFIFLWVKLLETENVFITVNKNETTESSQFNAINYVPTNVVLNESIIK